MAKLKLPLVSAPPLPPPHFYFAVGARSSVDDLMTAIHAGQRHLLVPAGSAMEIRLRTYPDPPDGPLSIVLDSGAWPANNPRRPTLHDYILIVCHWQTRLAGRFGGAFSYDHLGDPVRTAQDHARLMAYPWPGGRCPIVPVGHFPCVTAAQIVGSQLRASAALEAPADVYHPGPAAGSPTFALGGMVPANYSNALKAWYTMLLEDLVAVLEEEHVPVATIGLHLLGIASPAFTQHPLVRSYDSSGPATRAQYGVRHIEPEYQARYGLSLAKLARSRQARIAYWLLHYQARGALPWTPVSDALFPDDGEHYADRREDATTLRQLALFA